ncbi:hypothetical protein F4861DRAFT_451251 [Xylaria intraflava]|nr:hypothetical protein F4861DRAFT_451251 [Xylaria intraflava]
MTDQQEPVPLPSAPLVHLADNATLQPPLTRRGYGPGLILITPGEPPARTSQDEGPGNGGKYGAVDPPPQKKWAEEGYAVVKLDLSHGSHPAGSDVKAALDGAINALEKLETCNVKDQFALIVYGAPAKYPPSLTSELKAVYNNSQKLKASVSFSAEWDLAQKPQLLHLPGSPSPSPSNPNTKQYNYPSVQSPDYIHPAAQSYNNAAASLSHTRSLTFLKHHLGGPHFDLEAVWEEHAALEFATRSVELTMGTMVDEPYVNHVPVLTGGTGRASLTAFYRDHFIFCNPADTALELVSRTVGIDRVVDEFVAVLTHDRTVDWLLPGIPPTNKYLRIPVTSVVNVRGDRLYNEHIHWDQGTALRQAGLLPEYLPFPYPVAGAAPGARFEYRVPVAGAEAAVKLADAAAVEPNGMLGYGLREVRE